jgi:hypothetical protein
MAAIPLQAAPARASHHVESSALSDQRVVAVEPDDDEASVLEQVLTGIVGAMLRGIAMMCAVVFHNHARFHVEQVRSTE